jgi:hypothetical protein
MAERVWDHCFVFCCKDVASLGAWIFPYVGPLRLC